MSAQSLDISGSDTELFSSLLACGQIHVGQVCADEWTLVINPIMVVLVTHVSVSGKARP